MYMTKGLVGVTTLRPNRQKYARCQLTLENRKEHSSSPSLPTHPLGRRAPEFRDLSRATIAFLSYSFPGYR